MDGVTSNVWQIGANDESEGERVGQLGRSVRLESDCLVYEYDSLADVARLDVTRCDSRMKQALALRTHGPVSVSYRVERAVRRPAILSVVDLWHLHMLVDPEHRSTCVAPSTCAP